MNRRPLLHLCAATLLAPALARAHHGWSSFDQARPLYLAGRVATVAWRNPHAEITLDRELSTALPPDLAARALPAQSAPVDGSALLKATRLPTRPDRRWQVELAPLSRMSAWQVPELQRGQEVELIGFTFTGEKGDAVLRAEFLWVGGKVYGLRSSPA